MRRCYSLALQQRSTIALRYSNLSSVGRSSRVVPQRQLHNNKSTPRAQETTATPPPPDRFAANRGPVSWTSLFVVAVAAASAVAYYQVERERRMEEAMGKIVSSESDEGGWTPRPDYLAKRKFISTKYGWFPLKDGFGAREFVA